MISASTFDCTAIMHHACEIVRRANVARFGLWTILCRALRTAWSEAKHKLAIAQAE